MSENRHDEIPVKDITEAHRTKSLVMDKDRVLRRDEYHDRILQLSDENMLLKKHMRKQEDRAKQLEAKLSRILSEKKHIGRKDDYEAEENKCRILELEYQVGMLKDRLQVAKQQLVSYTKIFPIHPKQVKAKQSKVTSSNSSAGVQSTNYELSEQVEILLLEAKAENQALENQLHVLREQLLSSQRELQTAKELLQIKEIAHEDELALLRAQPVESEHKKKKLADNIQLIRLQRDSRRASSWLATLETQCKALESQLTTAQEQNQQLESQLNASQDELREVQQQNLNFQKQVEDSLANLSRVKELETQITALQDENKILKDAKETLQEKATASAKKAREVENEEATLKSKLSQMELSLKKEIQSKTDLYSDVTREKSKCSALTETLNELQKKFSVMEAEVKKIELKEKQSESSEKIPTDLTCKTSQESITITTRTTAKIEEFNNNNNNSNIDIANNNTIESISQKSSTASLSTLPTATGDITNNNTINTESVIPTQKSDTITTTTTSQPTSSNVIDASSSPKKVTSCEHCKLLEKDLAETRSYIEKLHDDFIKTKNLLRGQMATNRECHREVEALSTKLEKADKFHHEKLQEFMKVLEERAAQMLTLEKNLEIIKSQSATWKSSSTTIQTISSSSSPPPLKLVDSSVQVQLIESESKQPLNIFKDSPSIEIFVEKFVPAQNQSHLMNQSLFATWDYDEQGTKYTPIVRNGIFSSSSTHKIDQENFQNQVEIQIHQAIGPADCQTLGKGILSPESDTCILKSEAVPNEPIGELKYKFTIHGADLLKSRQLTTTASESPSHQISSSQQQQQQHPVPKPKPRKSPVQTEIQSSSSSHILQEGSDSSDKASGSKSLKKTKNGKQKILSKSISAQPSSSKDSLPKEQHQDDTVKSAMTTSTTTTATTNIATNETTIKIVHPSQSQSESLPSPKKPILRRESASPEVKKKLMKKVTVAEIVEERRIPSSDEEKYMERTSMSTRQRTRHHEIESISSSSGDMSGDGNSVVVVQPKKEVPDRQKTAAAKESSGSSKQIPIIKVVSIDSKENIQNANVKNFPIDSTTELEISSGSGDEANSHNNNNNNTSSSSKNNGSTTYSSRSKAKRKPRKLQPPPPTSQNQQQQQKVQVHSKELLQVSSSVDESFEHEFESSSLDSDTLKQTIRIEISYVIFNARCRIWTDPKVKKFYVEYRFLKYNPEDTETPNSLPKPQPGKKATFNFVKVFVIDTLEKRKALLHQIQEKKRLRFTLVSEPGEDDTLDCEDIGYAYVPMNVLEHEDLIQEELVIFDAENPRHKIGVIAVSIIAHDVIKTL